MKIQIELNERQLFAISRAGIKCPGTRKRFGEIGLTKIFSDRVKELPPELIATFKEDWALAASEGLNGIAPVEKKPEVSESRPDKNGTRVWKP